MMTLQFFKSFQEKPQIRETISEKVLIAARTSCSDTLETEQGGGSIKLLKLKNTRLKTAYFDLSSSTGRMWTEEHMREKKKSLDRLFGEAVESLQVIHLESTNTISSLVEFTSLCS